MDVPEGCSVGTVAGLEVVEDGGVRGEAARAERAIGHMGAVDCDRVLCIRYDYQWTGSR